MEPLSLTNQVYSSVVVRARYVSPSCGATRAAALDTESLESVTGRWGPEVRRLNCSAETAGAPSARRGRSDQSGVALPLKTQGVGRPPESIHRGSPLTVLVHVGETQGEECGGENIRRGGFTSAASVGLQLCYTEAVRFLVNLWEGLIGEWLAEAPGIPRWTSIAAAEHLLPWPSFVAFKRG